MIRFPGPLVDVTTKKGIALLNRYLNILFNEMNFSTGSGSGGSGGGAGAVWSTSTRPALPSYGARGYNTTLGGEEFYTPSGWLVIFGSWTTAGRPTGVVAGSQGFNTTIGSREYKWGSTDADWTQI